MKQPSFWFKPPRSPGLLATMLRPLSHLTERATARRLKQAVKFRADVPVVCVGNLNIGGSGKTPTAIAIADRLGQWGHAPHFVSRGYGGGLHGPTQVDVSKHKAADVGDEPLLLAAFAPTWVAKDRSEGVKAAQLAGAQAIILDDGFQNPSVAKDISIVVADAAIGFGNGLVFPAGPLREPVRTGLSRADLLCTVGDRDAQNYFSETWPAAADVARCRVRLTPLETGMDWRGLKVLAFAGIGHPEKFFDTLGELGADLVGMQSLDDHQPLTGPLLHRLKKEADAKGAQLVTTEKDAARLPSNFLSEVLTLVVRMDAEDWTELDLLLDRQGLSAKS